MTFFFGPGRSRSAATVIFVRAATDQTREPFAILTGGIVLTGAFRHRIASLLPLFAAVAAIAACSNPPSAQRTILDRQGSIKGLSQETFEVPVEQGDRLQIVLGQSGLDVYLQLEIGSQFLGRFDSFTGRYGEERVNVEMPQDGTLRLTVGAVRFPEVRGSFHLVASVTAPANNAEVMYAGASLVDRPQPSTQRVKRFEDAAELFASQGRTRESGLASFAALTLLNLTASDSKRAVVNGERAVAALREGRNELLLAAAHNALAAAHGEARQLKSMSTHFAEARRLYEAQDSEVGKVEVDLFEAALSDEGRYSEPLLQTYLGAVRKCAALGERVCEAFALIDIAGQVHYRGDFSLALDYLGLARKLVDPQADSGTVAEIHDTQASTLRMIGDFDGAIYHHKLALEAFGNFGECSGISRSYYGIAYALLGIGDNDQALRFYRLALDRSCTVGGPEPAQSRVANNALTSREMCDIAEPFAAFDEDDRAIAAWAAWDVGNLARSLSNPEVALHCHEIATNLATVERHVLGTQLERVRDYIDLGRTTEAQSLFSRVDPEVVANNPWYRAQRSEVAAQLEGALGRPRSAMARYASAAEEHRKAGNFEGVFSALSRRASLSAAIGDPGAVDDFANAEAALEDVRLLSLDPVFSALLFASGRRIYESWIATLLSREKDAPGTAASLVTLAISERSRARLLSQVTAASKVGQLGRAARMRSLSGTTIEVLKAAEEGRMPLAGGAPEAPPDSTAALNRLLGLDTGRLDVRAITAAVTTIDAYRRNLDDQTAVVEYLLGEKRSHAWVLRRNSVYRTDLGPASPIRLELEAFGDSLKNRASESDTKKALGRLHELLWKPLGIPAAISKVQIVPDDVLHDVPFAALWDVARNQYLVEQAAISSLPSIQFASSRIGYPLERAWTKGALLVGDPVYDLQDARERCSMDPQGGAIPSDVAELRRIPASGREVETIGATFRGRAQQVALLSGCAANRQEVLDARPGDYRIVHFATHATADRVLPQRSSIYLSGWNEKGSTSPVALTAADFLDHPVRSELVVLSGCSTAGGRQIGGEGSLGLTFSLIAGGSRQVMSTLWPVADAASVAAMSRFYDRLIVEDEAAVAALRAAQLEMLDSSRWNHPRYWAAYSLLGT